MTSSYTIASTPAAEAPRRRRSTWALILEESRKHAGAWRRVADPMSRTTASQIASDLRCAHQRNPATLRVKGVLPGDRWESRWGHDAAAPDPEKYFVWLRWVPEAPPSVVESAW